MTLRESVARALFSAVWLSVLDPASVEPREPVRRYEIFSNVRDKEGDLEGTELDLFFWEDDTVDATLTVYRRFVETNPVRLRGTRQDEEVSLSLIREEESLEIHGTRLDDRFDGQMTYKSKGKVVRTDPLNLPRRKLKR